MPENESNILAVLIDVKERNDFDIDDLLIKQCYELQKKYGSIRISQRFLADALA